MDEYLFTVLAKLKADRLKLEREARRERQQAGAAAESAVAHRLPRARRGREASELRSIVPTHGLRGWS